MSVTLKTSKEDLAKLQQEAMAEFAAAEDAKAVNDLGYSKGRQARIWKTNK
jgi:hypothetical protein